MPDLPGRGIPVAARVAMSDQHSAIEKKNPGDESEPPPLDESGFGAGFGTSDRQPPKRTDIEATDDPSKD
jgi:hypothetical protein